MTRKERRKIKLLANTVVTNRGWYLYLSTVDRLANYAAYPEKGKSKQSMDDLKTFIAAAAVVWDPESSASSRRKAERVYNSMVRK